MTALGPLLGPDDGFLGAFWAVGPCVPRVGLEGFRGTRGKGKRNRRRRREKEKGEDASSKHLEAVLGSNWRPHGGHVGAIFGSLGAS